MKFKSQYATLVLSSLLLSSCIAPLVIGGGAVVGTLATREKGIIGTVDDSQISVLVKAGLYQYDPDLHAKISVKGVKQVVNHIEVSEGESVGTIAQDALITTNVKTALLFDGDIRSLNYSIKTVNGVVYIMGIAQSQEELDKVTKYASSIKGVQKVLSYAKLKDEVPAEG